jgi:hypothetical protein
MTSPNLENMVKTGGLKKEPGRQVEFDGLVRSAKARLGDAHNTSLAIESRFDLAYNAAHSLALAALRWNGYRSDNRYLVFQCLPHTLGIKPEIWRVLALCHQKRNLAEYEGHLEVDERLLKDLIAAADMLLELTQILAPLPK